MNNKYKIVIIGDGGVGKTTFVKKHKTGEFERRYIASLGVTVHPLTFQTNHGEMTLDIWDCAGQSKFRGLVDGIYKDAHGAIVMCDLTSRYTFNRISFWGYDYVRMAPNTPIVLVANKSDMPPLYEVERGEGKFIISCKNNDNISAPLLYLLRKLSGHEDLYFLKL